MGLAIVGFVSTYGLHLLGLAHESERLRDYLLFVVCLIAFFLLRVFVETMFRIAPGNPGFLYFQILPAVACSLGSLLALMNIHSARPAEKQTNALNERLPSRSGPRASRVDLAEVGGGTSTPSQ